MPAELIGEDGGAEGDVHIIDKSGEPYKPPTVAEKPFQGQGRSMREEGSSSGARSHRGAGAHPRRGRADDDSSGPPGRRLA